MQLFAAMQAAQHESQPNPTQKMNGTGHDRNETSERVFNTSSKKIICYYVSLN